MAIRKVLHDGDPILRKKSKPVVNFDEDLEMLLDDMKESMRAFDGMGLAAVQLGVLRRAVIVEVNNMFLEIINPEIIKEEGETIHKEGCLSVPDFNGKVKRPLKITVNAFDRLGNPFTIIGQDWLARCICHEIDHLNGILYVDRLENKKEYLEFKKGNIK